MLVVAVGVDVDGVWLEVKILVEKEHSLKKALVCESGYLREKPRTTNFGDGKNKCNQKSFTNLSEEAAVKS